jgi:hypothetical protein
MPKFKKGSKEAKAYMAKIRAKRKKATTKKVGATKIIERGEKKSTPAKKVYQRVRTKTGTFKGLKRVGTTHADTKSHNVKISIGGKKSDINFSVYVKGKRVLTTQSPTTAISEAKFYSTAFNTAVYIKTGKSVLGKYMNGKKIK